VARTDSGRNTFNFAEWGGNAAAVALSNAWYPDTRDVSDNVQKLLIQCATDTFSQVLKEFWPDVKRHFQKKHEDPETLPPASRCKAVQNGDCHQFRLWNWMAVPGLPSLRLP